MSASINDSSKFGSIFHDILLCVYLVCHVQDSLKVITHDPA